MRTKKKNPYVFIGASISSRDAQAAQEIAGRIRRVCAVLDRLGYTYDADLVSDTAIHKDAANAEFEIPEKYLRQVSQGIEQSVHALRVENPPYSLREEIACHYWSLDLLNQCVAAIFDLTRSSSGTGFEIASAIQMKKPCLALFEHKTMSTTIYGCTSRLLTVRRWEDDIETIIERFLQKAHSGLDRIVKFKVTQEMASRLDTGAKRRGHGTISEYLRYLVEQDAEVLENLNMQDKGERDG